jgi:outer membrane lipoprotein carrier protein
LALSGSVAGAEAPASSCAAEAGVETAARVQRRYDGIRDLAAGFEQESRSATFGGQPLMDADVKRGEVVFAKPGRMRWRYAEPEPSLVVSDGETLWIHDVEGGTATRLEVTAGYLSGAALQFLLGDGEILASFDVEATRCTPERVELTLLPKEDATYERLGLVADPETGDIVATSVVDLFGNETEIRFRDVVVNQTPSAETFSFVPPEGVELIDYAAGAAAGTAAGTPADGADDGWPSPATEGAGAP